jgi:hypothetical protein
MCLLSLHTHSAAIASQTLTHVVLAVVDCGAAATVANGKITDESGRSTYLARTSATCDTGYEMSGPTWRTCQADGRWSDSDTPTVCTPRSCGEVSAPAHTEKSCPDGNRFQNKCTIGCKEGYDLVPPTSASAKAFVVGGKVQRVCGADGRWTGFDAECAIKVCDTAANGPMENGSESCPSGHEYGDKCTFTCKTGYHLKGTGTVGASGTNTTVRECLKTGLWDSSTELKCEPDQCKAHDAPAGGSVSCSSTSLDGTCLFSCNVGYTRVGAETTKCLPGGKWSNTAAVCQIKVSRLLNDACLCVYIARPEIADTSSCVGLWDPGGARERECRSR